MARSWDEKFTGAEYLYGLQPNVFIEACAHTFDPHSQVLCLGEGEGRNAVYLAKKGHRVEALDNSSVGLEKARLFAGSEGISITTTEQDLERWDPKEECYDYVVSSYLHLKEPLRTKVFIDVVKSLKSGGAFCGEFFSKAQYHLTSGGPKDLELLYDAREMVKVLENLPVEIERCDQLETILDEGKGHQGLASVVRIVFLKD